MAQEFLTAKKLGAFSKSYHFYLGSNELLPFHAWGDDGSFAVDRLGRVVLIHSFKALCELEALNELKTGERFQIFTSYKNGLVADRVVCVAVPVVYNYHHLSLWPVVSLNPVEREVKKLVTGTELALQRAFELMPKGGDDVIRAHRLGCLYWPFGGVVREPNGDYKLAQDVSCNGEIILSGKSRFSVVLNVPTPDQVEDGWKAPFGDFLSATIIARHSPEVNSALVRQTFAKGSFVNLLEGKSEGVNPSEIKPLAYSQFFVMSNTSARALAEDVHGFTHEMIHTGNCVDKVCLALGDTIRALVPGGGVSPFVTFIDQPLVADCVAAYHRC